MYLFDEEDDEDEDWDDSEWEDEESELMADIDWPVIES